MDSVQHLADQLAIVQLLNRYGFALDDRDWEALRTCFTADAVYTFSHGLRVEGFDEIAGVCRRALDPLDLSQHIVTNHLVELSGDRATARSYLHGQHVRRGIPDGETYIVAGRYTDELVRTPDGWRICARDLTSLWEAGNPLVLERNRLSGDDGSS